MCEFKIIKQNDGSQILEDIVILTYTENNELLFKDVLGIGELLKSALIVDVNTLNQTCVVVEHPLIKEFIPEPSAIWLKLVATITVARPTANKRI